jgi:agmatinase
MHTIKFLDFNTHFDDAHVVLLGAPLEYSIPRAGMIGGPNSIRHVSHMLESYSMKLNRSLKNMKLCDLGGVTFGKDIIESLRLISEEIEAVGTKKIVVIGGEHTVMIGVIEALKQKYPELVIIQIDAHADLRDEYEGKKYSHAAVIRRCLEILGPGRIYQLGIRSIEEEELKFAQENTVIYDQVIPDDKLLDRLQGVPVYISIDLDVLDPAYAPGVSVPEPCGVTPHELFNTIYTLSKLNNIVGFEIVEISPTYDPTQITAFIAAKIIREAVLSFWGNNHVS